MTGHEASWLKMVAAHARPHVLAGKSLKDAVEAAIADYTESFHRLTAVFAYVPGDAAGCPRQRERDTIVRYVAKKTWTLVRATEAA